MFLGSDEEILGGQDRRFAGAKRIFAKAPGFDLQSERSMSRVVNKKEF